MNIEQFFDSVQNGVKVVLSFDIISIFLLFVAILLATSGALFFYSKIS